LGVGVRPTGRRHDGRPGASYRLLAHNRGGRVTAAMMAAI
jgi:hypothetical protein